MDAFVRRVRGAIRRENLIEPGEIVLVGISGGPDSTALLAALAELGDWKLAAVHVNHGLRGTESGRDEEMARGAAARCGVPFESVLVDVRPRRRGIEAEARARREGALADAARRLGARTIAVGHTLDDQAETVLYRAARGAGPRGLRGILPARPADDARLVRPLLGIRRTDVLAFLARRDLQYATDSSNLDLRFARNRIRHEVLPALEKARPGAARNLARLARAAHELAEWIDGEAAKALERCRLPSGLDTATLAGLPPPLRDAVIERALPAGAGPPLAAHRDALRKLFARSPRRIADLRDGWIAVNDGRVVRFEPRPPAPDTGIELSVPGEATLAPSGTVLRARVEPARQGFLEDFVRTKTGREEALDLDCVSTPLWASPPLPGERFHPLGAPGERRISDVLADLKVPRRERRTTLVLRDSGGKPLWLVGFRIDHRVRVTAETRRLLLLDVTPRA